MPFILKLGEMKKTFFKVMLTNNPNCTISSTGQTWRLHMVGLVSTNVTARSKLDLDLNKK